MKLEEKRRAIEAQKKKVNRRADEDTQHVEPRFKQSCYTSLFVHIFSGGSSFHSPSSEDGQDSFSECGKKKRGDHPGQSQLRRRNTLSSSHHTLHGGQPRQHGAGGEVQT